LVAYGQSKTANALFAVALDSIGWQRGVRAFSVHPGGTITDLIRHMSQAAVEATRAIDKDGKPIIDPQNNTVPSQKPLTRYLSAPETSMIVPVVKLERSLARYRAVVTISSGRPIRRIADFEF
jgi:NAD(P)-dependent dehydrogenase (short-subunit alcohol dehydrogenase family)